MKRILIGPIRTNDPEGQNILEGLRKHHDVIAFATQDSDIVYDFSRETFQDILNKLPAEWKPHLVLFFSPEYQGVPSGIETYGCPTVALVGDWNMGFHTSRITGAAFDAILTDRQGVEVFKRAGASRVAHAKLFGFSPSLHIRQPEVEQIYDISIACNLNHEVQRERSRWLGRIAALSSRYHVRIVTGYYGEDYVRLIQQSKITFNRSIRGEMNMRAYEAPACGSLLFYEEENLEVRDVYTDREHCVLYNEDNLETLLEYYLEHDDERQQIVESAWERVQDYSYARQAERLLEAVEGLKLYEGETNRPLRSLAPAEQHQVWAIQAMQSVTPGNLIASERHIRIASEQLRDDPALENNAGVLYATAAATLQIETARDQSLESAITCFQQAASLAPDHAVIQTNQGQILFLMGRGQEAESYMKAALGSLDACAAESFQKFLFFPRSYDAFNVEFERIGAAMIDKPEAYAKAIRRLYRWKLHERLGNLYSRREEWDKADAAYRKAVEATQVGTTRFQHALALLKLGQNESASVALEGALEHEPFLFEAREHQARLLFEAADFEVCRACCQEALHIIRGCPIYEPKAAPFQELLFRCQNRGTDLTDTAQPRQYRILTFNWHEPFLSSVCKTGHYFDIVGVGAMGRTTIDGIQTWNTGKREFPANATLLVEFEEVQKHIQQGVYDLALCFTSFDLAFLKQADMPKIFCPLSSPMNDLGDQYEDSSVREGYLQSIKKLTSKVLITYITDLMGREDCGGYGLPGTVVSKGPPVDPANYDGYTGKTPAVLRVGNLIAERWFLNYGIQQRVLEGIPHQILGTNPSIPGARCSESREDLLDHLRRYRLFFHSFDKRMMEGHASTSLIEAMMTGMPVVSTEHPLSIIVDGVHGFVTDDIPTLRKRIQELLEDREMAIELGRNAQALAIEYFGIQNFIRKMNEAFAKCIRCNSIPLGIDGSPPSSQSEKRHAEAGNSIRPFSPNNWEQFELRPVPGTEFSEINGIIGFMVPGDVQFLMVKAATLPHGGTIVEIGSFMGLSSVLMAQTLMRTGNHQARIYSVDTWEGSPEHQGLEIIKNRQLFDIFKDNIQKAGISSFIHPIRKSSTVAFEDFEDGSIDLLFVDGDHSFEGCYSDLIHWFPKLRPGGGLIGHDCEPDSGVRAAVKKFSSETGIPYTIHPLPKTHYMFEFDLTDHWDRQAKKSGLAVKDNTHIEPPDDRVTLSSIVWSAPFLEQGDDADDARSLTLGLENLGLPIKIDPVKLTGQSADLDEPLLQKLEQMHGVPLSSEGFVHVMHLAPPFYQKAPGAAVNIGRANFGADRLPIEWVPRCNEMDEIWVPSDFNIESFAFSGVDRERLHKIPLCFDAQKFGEHVPPVQMPKKLGFWFLAAIDWHTASGWDALLRAYMEEFSAEDDLSLMLQLMLPAGVTPQDAAEEIRSFLKDELRVSNPHANLDISIDPLRPGLYRAADAFILPGRGESLGLHCLEAMASGLPVIATGWGGHTEFMTTENSWPIDYQMTDVPDEVVAEIPFLAGSRWAEPDTRHLRSLMRHAFENREETAQKGKAAAAHAAKNFSREKVAQLVKTRLTKMSLPPSPPPRILVGTGPFSSFRENLKDVARTCDVLSVGEEKGDIRWACEKDTFQDILERLPDGWQPDLVLWLCHYNPIPEGIENSPFPTVAAVGDWNLLWTSFQEDLKRFDWIVSDKAGVEVIRRAGHTNVDYWPMFCYETLTHRRIDGLERIYDVTIVGNLNHDIQRKRAHSLRKIAALNDRYTVRIFTGVWGEEYNRVLSQSKIVFNQSIRGEMNMRAYEATACGALLFMEEDNLEINDFFKDRVECVLYNEDNLEEFIEYYLTHDEERERIAEAGYQRVQQETQRHHFERLVALLQERNVAPALRDGDEELAAERRDHKRTFLDLPEPQRLFRQARQAFEKQRPNGESLQAAEKLLIQVLEHDPAHTETYNALGVLNGYYSQLVQDESAKNELFAKAEQSFAGGLKHGPNDALLLYNLGVLHVMSGHADPAEAALNQAIQSIEQNQPLQCRELILPRTFNAFFVEWERIAAELIHDPAAADNARRQLLLHQCCDWLGDIATFKELTSTAVELYRRAIDARPDLAGRPRHKLAGLLHRLGQTEEAIEQYRQAYAEEPFNTQLWKDLVAILRESGRNEEAESVCQELLTIVEACPAYKESQAWLEESVHEIQLPPVNDETPNASS